MAVLASETSYGRSFGVSALLDMEVSMTLV